MDEVSAKAHLSTVESGLTVSVPKSEVLAAVDGEGADTRARRRAHEWGTRGATGDARLGASGASTSNSRTGPTATAC